MSFSALRCMLMRFLVMNTVKNFLGYKVNNMEKNTITKVGYVMA